MCQPTAYSHMPHIDSVPQPGEGGSATGDPESSGEVAAKLVRAYAELRQLDYLLASLTAALRDAGAGAAAIIESAAFQAAQRKVNQQTSTSRSIAAQFACL